jgi:hypothetical protein
MLCQLGRSSGLFRALTFESHHVSQQAQTVSQPTPKSNHQDGVIERFFGPLPLNSTHPSNRATGFSRKPQVVGEQNEAVGHPTQNAGKERSSSLCDASSLKGWANARQPLSQPLEICVAGIGSVDLLHIIPARAVATLQLHISDDAMFCRAGNNTVRPHHDGQVFWRSLFYVDRLPRSRRLDAERHPRPDRRFGLRRSEVYLAARRELILLADHAGRDAVDVGNFRTAKAKRIVAAGCLLLGSVGLARSRPHRNRERRSKHQTELEIPRPDSQHDSPRNSLICELWVNDRELASTATIRGCGKLDTPTTCYPEFASPT